MQLGPLSIKKWDAGEKNGEIGQFLAELVFWLSCKISFFTISNHTNGAADLIRNSSQPDMLGNVLHSSSSVKRQLNMLEEGWFLQLETCFY